MTGVNWDWGQRYGGLGCHTTLWGDDFIWKSRKLIRKGVVVRKVFLVACVRKVVWRYRGCSGRETGRLVWIPVWVPPEPLSCLRPKIHPKRTFGFLPPTYCSPFLLGVRVGGPSPPQHSLSHSFLVKLARDNVRINDKICKACSSRFGKGEKKCHECVIFRKSGFLCVFFFPGMSEAGVNGSASTQGYIYFP